MPPPVAFANTVLLLDASPCHIEGKVVNMLFGDGHVESRPREQWMAVLNRVATDIRPVLDPASTTAPQPVTRPAMPR